MEWYIVVILTTKALTITSATTTSATTVTATAMSATIRTSIIKTIENYMDWNDPLMNGELSVEKCDEIINYWGKLTMPDGVVITPQTLWSVVISDNGWDMCCRDYISEAHVTAFIIVVYKDELYYLDVNKAYDVQGDMWDLGKNCDPEYEIIDGVRFEYRATLDTWNTYIIPDMSTYNGKIIKMIKNTDCVFAFSKKTIETVRM